jgi:hypothetical protein
MPDCWQAARMVWLSVLPILSVPSVLDDANDDPSCASQVVRLDLMQLTAAFAFTGSGCATSSMSKLDASWAVFGRLFAPGCAWCPQTAHFSVMDVAGMHALVTNMEVCRG